MTDTLMSLLRIVVEILETAAAGEAEIEQDDVERLGDCSKECAFSRAFDDHVVVALMLSGTALCVTSIATMWRVLTRKAVTFARARFN